MALGAGSVGIANAATLEVTTTADSGPGSLRAAILAANSQSGTDTIDFSVGSGDKTISPASPLPAITSPVIVDATTQPGFSGTPLIRLDGASASSAAGLLVEGGPSTVRGLAITGFAIGIQSEGTGGNRFAGNEIGVHAGMVLPNGSGIYVGSGSSNNVIGGTTPADRNVISGNTDDGVVLTEAQTSGNQVEGNYIGTNAAGTAAIANGDQGVYILSGASGNTVGGTAPGAGNLISGNTEDGVYVSAANNNVIEGNYIGTNAAGTASIGNRRGVIVTDAATGNTVGGAASGSGNVVSGNRDDGVVLFGAGTTGNLIAGNYVGTNAAGTGAIPNGGPDGGIYIGGNSANNTIGGTAAGARNVVSGNAQNGIDIYSDGAAGNLVEGNYVGTNAAGTGSVPNSAEGVFLEGNANGNTVGGTSAGARNLISGNGLNGVEVFSGANSNLIEGNYIGTDPAGTTAVPNGSDGVAINESPNNTVGGTVPGAGNLISGNGDDGIAVYGTAATGNVLQGNFIGTGPGGSGALGNLGPDAISIGGGAAQNTIGGTGPGAGNTITHATSGVEVNGSSTTADAILGNSIFANSQLGIALTSGGNANAPAPSINSVSSGPSATAISGTATPATARVEVFSNSDCSDPEGAHFLGSVNASSGSWSLTVSQIAAGQGLTATATDPAASNTSPFSSCVVAPSPSSSGPPGPPPNQPPPNQPPPNQPPANQGGPVTASFTYSPSAPNTGQTVTFDASATTGSVASYSWWFDDGSGGSGVTAQHAYTFPGAYTVILTVTDTNGNTYRTSRAVTVGGQPQQQPPPNQPPPNQPPPPSSGPATASFTYSPSAPNTGQTVTFDASGSTGSIVSYSWWFDDGSGGTGVTAQHAYTSPGAYTVILTVTDTNGNTYRTSRSITVGGQPQQQPPPNQPPSTQPPPSSSGSVTASFTYSPSSPATGQTVTFDASGSTGSIASYSWWFDDGSGDTGVTAQHAYTFPGAYTVILTVTDTNGNTYRTGRSITVTSPSSP